MTYQSVKRSAKPSHEVKFQSGQRGTDLVHRAPEGERTKIDCDETETVDQFDYFAFRLVVFAGCE
jgi:hypothetical protein